MKCCPFAACVKSRAFLLAAGFLLAFGALLWGVVASGTDGSSRSCPMTGARAGQADTSCEKVHAGLRGTASREARYTPKDSCCAESPERSAVD